MNFRDSNQDSTEAKYISKRVMINGQFVTLYSANGQTWVSSPEELPALMDRLENTRVSLNTAERVAEGEGAKTAEPEAQDKKKEAQSPPERILATKYRVKGPKPRPILRQDGVVIKGTPIDPISASNVGMSFSSDVKDPDRKSARKSEKSSKSATEKPKKIIAPLVTKKQAKSAEKSSQQLKQAAAPSIKKTIAVVPVNPKGKPQKVLPASKASALGVSKVAAAKPAPKKISGKAAAKTVTKTTAKRVANRTATKAAKKPAKTATKRGKSQKGKSKKSR